jgi:DNA-binding MarR family transcriptional regulator
MKIAIANNDSGSAALDDPLAQLPGYALRRAANAMMGDLSERLSKIELRLSDASVLMLLRHRSDVTASEIGRTLDIQRANMVPLLNRLEAAGLLERRALDRKSYAVVLTEAGRTTLMSVDAITTAFEADLVARVPAEHRAHLLPALNALWR